MTERGNGRMFCDNISGSSTEKCAQAAGSLAESSALGPRDGKGDPRRLWRDLSKSVEGRLVAE